MSTIIGLSSSRRSGVEIGMNPTKYEGMRAFFYETKNINKNNICLDYISNYNLFLKMY
jgi:hypothetical protein